MMTCRLRLPSVLLAGLAASLPCARATAHPSLYFGAEDLPALQARAADEAVNVLGYDFASAFREMRDRADRYASEPCTYTVAIPDPDGAGTETWTYVVSSEMPPAHTSNPGYPPWTGLSREIQRRLETLAFVHAITGEEAYLTNVEGHGALDLALDVAAWTGWTDPGYGCGGRTCLDTAHLTMGMALVYDLGFASMSDEQRALLRDAIVRLGVTPLEADVSAANEAGTADAWFNGHALRVTGLAVGAAAVAEDVGAQAPGWLTVAGDSIESFFWSQGVDGGAFEGQLYGAYAVDQLVIGAHALARAGAEGSLLDDDWLRTVPRFAAAFLGSDGQLLANFGDSTQGALWGSTMEALAAYGDATAQWYLQRTGLARPGSPLAFVWARPDLPPEPLPGSGTTLFRDVGHAALRAGFAGEPVVAVKSGPPTVEVGHNHFDHNSFMLSAFGEWIASDPGYRNYFDAARRTYTTESVGHNTLLVDPWVSPTGDAATGGQIRTAGGVLDYLFDGAGYAKVVANAADTYEPGLLSRFGRRIFYAKPDLVWVFDDVAAPEAHEYSFLLHAPAGGSAARGEGPAEAVITGLLARVQAFVVCAAPLSAGSPEVHSHPGAESYGPYVEWRTTSAPATMLVTALVPGRFLHTEFLNPGFEQELTSWQPRFVDGTHDVDAMVSRSGSRSARIVLSEENTGYFYSEPLSVLPGASVTASIFARAQASGTLSVVPYWMLSGAYIPEPAGEGTSLDAATAQDWTAIEIETTVPGEGVDAVRIAVQFSGTGTVWFDDAHFETSPRADPSPLSRAVALGEPPVGLVVEGPFGVEAAASLVGSGVTGETTLQPATEEIDAVPSLSSDGSLFAVGLGATGDLRRAFLQGGTFVAVGETDVVRSAATASFDVAVIRDEQGCPTVHATEVVTLQNPPYRVRANAEQVLLNGERVAFAIEGPEVVFPLGSDLGPGCPGAGPDPDAGLDGGVPASDGGAPDAGASEGADGCGCRTPRRGAHGTDLGAVLLCAGLVCWLRRSRARRPGR